VHAAQVGPIFRLLCALVRHHHDLVSNRNASAEAA
jgi:hypothetical protein